MRLALVEHQVTDAGGTYAFCDTDSMAIVAKRHGGVVKCPGGPLETIDGSAAVRALSRDEVDVIRDRFAALNPYDPSIVPGSILELEDENYTAGQRRQLHCYAISAKRYTFVLETADGISLVKPSQHGLGHLLNPSDADSNDRDWIRETWEWLIADALESDVREPAWLDRPAVGRLSVSSPHLHRLLRRLNDGRYYSDQVKPFNFLLIAFVHPLERPADDQRMVLIAPYSSNPHDWTTGRWLNRHTATPYIITVEASGGHEREGVVTVKTYRESLVEYATHPETKSGDACGSRCNRRTRGLLARRHVEARTVTHIGKEANQLDESQAGLLDDADGVLTAYDDTDALYFRTAVLPRLRALGVREVARRTGHSVAAVHAVLVKDALPRRDARSRYETAVS